jgi:cytochrome b
MTKTNNNAFSNASLAVWDPFVRVFHWSLVALMAIAFLSGDDAKWPHVPVGYVILALVSLRIAWGFIGTKHARFTDFVKGPSEIFDYLKGLIIGAPKHYVGHNPAGGAMIVLLLATTLFLCYSGMKAQEFYNEAPIYVKISLATNAYAGDEEEEGEEEEEHGSFSASPATHAAHEFWEETHEGAAWFLLMLIIVHITAAVFTSIVHNENLVLSMITGKKPALKT